MIFSLDKASARLGSGNQWASNGRSAITLMKTSDFRIVLIALGLGEIMHEHRAEGPITLLVQQGLIRLKAEGLEHVLQREMLLTLGHRITHEIEACDSAPSLATLLQILRLSWPCSEAMQRDVFAAAIPDQCSEGLFPSIFLANHHAQIIPPTLLRLSGCLVGGGAFGIFVLAPVAALFGEVMRFRNRFTNLTG